FTCRASTNTIRAPSLPDALPISWGTGPGVLAPFVARVKEHIRAGRLRVHFRYRVTDLVTEAGRVTGASGAVLAEDPTGRGVASSDRKSTRLNSSHVSSS